MQLKTSIKLSVRPSLSNLDRMSARSASRATSQLHDTALLIEMAPMNTMAHAHAPPAELDRASHRGRQAGRFETPGPLPIGHVGFCVRGCIPQRTGGRAPASHGASCESALARGQMGNTTGKLPGIRAASWFVFLCAPWAPCPAIRGNESSIDTTTKLLVGGPQGPGLR